jgi:hypothetical protein
LDYCGLLSFCNPKTLCHTRKCEQKTGGIKGCAKLDKQEGEWLFFTEMLLKISPTQTHREKEGGWFRS